MWSSSSSSSSFVSLCILPGIWNRKIQPYILPRFSTALLLLLFFALKKINTYVCVCVCVFVLEQRNEKLIDNVDDALDDDENAVVVIVADDDDDDVFVVVECMSGSVE